MNTNEDPGMNIEPKTDGKAIGSLVCGILSVTILSIIAGIPAIILGHISRSGIRKSAGRMKGGGMALAGLIMGYISLAIIPIIIILAAIAIPSLLRSRQAAHEAAAVATLRTVNTAEVTYGAVTDGKFGSISDLIDKSLLPPNFKYQPVSGYNFTVELNSGNSEFVATAKPASANEGRYGYYVTSDGDVHYSMDPSLAPAGTVGAPLVH